MFRRCLQLAFVFVLLGCECQLATGDGFEDYGVYSIRSTTSTLILGLRNTSALNVPVMSQNPAVTVSGIDCKQRWEAVESTVQAGHFFLRGQQEDDENGGGTLLVMDLVDGYILHTEYASVARQRWFFEPICGTDSGLIHNGRDEDLCLQDNGVNETVTAQPCDLVNGAMLWKLDPAGQKC